MGYALRAEVDQPFADTLEATRAALGEQGFGVLTEIDLQATLKAKLDADIDPQVILGACRPRWRMPRCRLSPPSACCCRATSSSAPWAAAAPSSRPRTRRSW